MGYYIEGPAHGKAAFLLRNEDAVEVSQEECEDVIEDPDFGVICIVDNGHFEAAAFCYDAAELRAFTYLGDSRPRRWLLMNRERAEQLSGYK